jgi:hypothetical protein
MNEEEKNEEKELDVEKILKEAEEFAKVIREERLKRKEEDEMWLDEYRKEKEKEIHDWSGFVIVDVRVKYETKPSIRSEEIYKVRKLLEKKIFELDGFKKLEILNVSYDIRLSSIRGDDGLFEHINKKHGIQYTYLVHNIDGIFFRKLNELLKDKDYIDFFTIIYGQSY